MIRLDKEHASKKSPFLANIVYPIINLMILHIYYRAILTSYKNMVYTFFSSLFYSAGLNLPSQLMGVHVQTTRLSGQTLRFLSTSLASFSVLFLISYIFIYTCAKRQQMICLRGLEDKVKSEKCENKKKRKKSTPKVYQVYSNEQPQSQKNKAILLFSYSDITENL